MFFIKRKSNDINSFANNECISKCNEVIDKNGERSEKKLFENSQKVKTCSKGNLFFMYTNKMTIISKYIFFFLIEIYQPPAARKSVTTVSSEIQLPSVTNDTLQICTTDTTNTEMYNF